MQSVSPSPVIKSYWPSKSDCLGIPSPSAGSAGCKAWQEAQNLHDGRTSLVLLLSRLWVGHLAGMGFDFIVFAPLLPSCCSFFFVFGRGISFFGGFQCPSVNGYSTASCNFGALAGGDEHMYFCLTIFDINFSLKCFLLYNHPLCFSSLLTLLRLLMARWKISIGKCHITLENMWFIFKYLLILIFNIIPQWQENILCMISVSLDHKFFLHLFYVPGYVPVSSSL